MVLNIHTRDLHTSRDAVGALLDSLASKQDLLWPHDRWPTMRLDRPLQIGAAGGHGPIRYRVEWYEPGRAVLFRFPGRSCFAGCMMLWSRMLLIVQKLLSLHDRSKSGVGLCGYASSDV